MKPKRQCLLCIRDCTCIDERIDHAVKTQEQLSMRIGHLERLREIQRKGGLKESPKKLAEKIISK